MSIKALGMVWKHSRAKGGDLLVALAIADFADDEGNAYPSIPTLGKKSRLSDRQVKRSIQHLEDLGELRILRGKGPHGTNRYQIQGDIMSRDKLSRGVTNEAQGGDICGKEGVTPMSPNPSEETVRRNRHAFKCLDFEKFWFAYPKKKSKGDAEKAWRALKPNEQLQDRIVDALERATTSAEWLKDGGQFIPYPATWLRAKGWEDECVTSAASTSPTGCLEKIPADDGRTYRLCGCSISLDQPSPPRPFCAEHLPGRQRIAERLTNGHAS